MSIIKTSSGISFWLHPFRKKKKKKIKDDQNLRFGAIMEEPTFSAREEEEEVEEEEEQALPGKVDLVLRVDGTTSRERLMGITARVEGTTRPWYSKSLETGEKSQHGSTVKAREKESLPEIVTE